MGGPIKEGVMHGIREPKRNGGLSKQFNTGLVGDERYPKTDGRAHHFAFLAPLAFNIARTALMPLGRLGMQKALRAGLIRGPGGTVRGGLGKFRPETGADMANKLKFDPNRLGKYLAGSPEGKFVTGAGGKLSQWVPKIAKGAAKSPLTMAGGAYALTDIFPGGKPFGPDKYLPNILGQRFDEEGKKIPGTGLFNPEVVEEKKEIIEEPTVKKLTAAEKKLIEETKKKNAKLAKEERVNNLLEIMGYDKAKKTAAYDALIDAGQTILQRGTLDKKNIGRELIDPIVEQTSKRFDKPEQLREAVGLMMTKGEIEKDIAKGKGGQLQQNARDLVAGGVFPDMASALDHLAKKPSLREKAITFAQGMKKGGIDQEVVISTIHDQFGEIPKVLVDETEMEKERKKDTFTSDIATFTELVKAQDLGPGYYVIGDSGFVIDSNKKIKQLL